jgi:dUTP pyrophosphatase
MMTNSQGVIDKTYRGTLKAPVTLVSREALGDQTFEGIRLFQIVAPDMGDIVEVRIVESLSETARGSGGFGSTGTSGDAGEQPAGERPEQPAGERPEQQSLADLLVSGVNVTTL